MGAGRLIATATMLVATVAAVEMTVAGPGFAASLRDNAATSSAATSSAATSSAATSSAATSSAAARPTQLVLTVAKGETSRPAQWRASLTCSPAGGTHKQARNACAELARVGGNFGKLQLGGGVCTMQWDPVTVTATGRWKGKKISYQHTYGNACTLSTTTGPVFSLY
jgi:hypothetical protein